MTKPEVGTLMNLNRPQRIVNNRSDKLRGPHTGKFRVEGSTKTASMPVSPSNSSFVSKGVISLGQVPGQEPTMGANRTATDRSECAQHSSDFVQNELVAKWTPSKLPMLTTRGSQLLAISPALRKLNSISRTDAQPV